MAVVRAFTIEGCKLWFPSSDHEPPHFHVQRSGEWHMKVHFLFDPDEMIEEVWVERRPAERILNRICSLAEQHRVALLQQWGEIHSN